MGQIPPKKHPKFIHKLGTNWPGGNARSLGGVQNSKGLRERGLTRQVDPEKVSDMVAQLQNKRDQQQSNVDRLGGEGRVEVQDNQWDWEVEDNSNKRGFKSKRGDRSLSASPTLMKKVRPLMDWAGRVVEDQQ